MSDEQQQQLINFLLPRDLLRAVDNFRFDNHFQSRKAAIQWLLEWALFQKPTPSYSRNQHLQESENDSHEDQ
jgi:hypothetical protein